MSDTPHVTPHERLVLNVLAAIYDHDGNCFNFKSIETRTKLNRRQVKRACRSLARKGLTEYERGLFDPYDGNVAGAGYSCTPKGRTVANELGLSPEEEMTG